MNQSGFKALESALDNSSARAQLLNQFPAPNAHIRFVGIRVPENRGTILINVLDRHGFLERKGPSTGFASGPMLTFYATVGNEMIFEDHNLSTYETR